MNLDKYTNEAGEVDFPMGKLSAEELWHASNQWHNNHTGTTQEIKRAYLSFSRWVSKKFEELRGNGVVGEFDQYHSWKIYDQEESTDDKIHFIIRFDGEEFGPSAQVEIPHQQILDLFNGEFDRAQVTA